MNSEEKDTNKKLGVPLSLKTKLKKLLIFKQIYYYNLLTYGTVYHQEIGLSILQDIALI